MNSRRPGVSDGFQPLLDSTPGLPLATLHYDTRLHKTIVCVCERTHALSGISENTDPSRFELYLQKDHIKKHLSGKSVL